LTLKLSSLQICEHQTEDWKVKNPCSWNNTQT
jgi:hypothetical protein